MSCVSLFKYALFKVALNNRANVIHPSRWAPALALLFSMVVASASHAQGTELIADVDRTVIGENETVQLTVRLNEQVGYGSPDFQHLQDDFEVVSRRRSSQFRSVNGRTESWTDWTLELAPKKTGTLSIPSFSYQGAVSNALEITVTEASATSSDGLQEIFVEVETDKPELFVQEQLLVTIKIHTGILLRDASMNEELKVDNAVVENVSETAYNKQLNGRLYRVMELVYAVYPQRSGTLTIPSLSWNLVMATDRGSGLRYRFQTPGQLRRVHSEELTIPVKSKPSHYRGEQWLPAKEVTLKQHWSSDPSRFVVGEPLTRTITLTADGLTASQLPPLPEQTIDGIKVYADQPQLDDIINTNGVIGSRIESVAIVPTQAGKLTLPETRVSWWDTQTQRERVATIPPQTLTVAAAPINTTAINPLTSASDGAESSDGESDQQAGLSIAWPWLISNLMLAGLALLFMFAWLKARKEPNQERRDDRVNAHSETLEAAFHAVRRACSENDPRAVRNALGEWGRLYWQLPHAASLQDIIGRCDSAAVTKQLAELDKILYGNQQSAEANWQGEKLWRALVKFKQQDKKKRHAHTQKEKNSLPPLYPTGNH
ncbi:MAG: BatD family protein [Cellvibrionaceae bacterium]